MCGAYQGAGIEVTVTQLQEVLADAVRISQDWEAYAARHDAKQGLVRRTDVVPVLTAGGILPMRWGFTVSDSREVFPHARWETILQRSMFRYAAEQNRCLIPTFTYSEKRYQFWPANTAKEQEIFLMAGVYRHIPGQDTAEFAVVTRDAAPHILHIHDRMPVILSAKDAQAWLAPDAPVLDVLSRAILSVQFEAKKEKGANGVEQLGFF